MKSRVIIVSLPTSLSVRIIHTFSKSELHTYQRSGACQSQFSLKASAFKQSQRSWIQTTNVQCIELENCIILHNDIRKVYSTSLSLFWLHNSVACKSRITIVYGVSKIHFWYYRRKRNLRHDSAPNERTSPQIQYNIRTRRVLFSPRTYYPNSSRMYVVCLSITSLWWVPYSLQHFQWLVLSCTCVPTTTHFFHRGNSFPAFLVDTDVRTTLRPCI